MMKHFVLKPIVKVVIIAILILLLCLSTYLIILGKNTSNKVSKYNYNLDENVDYKVYLKDNEFFEEKYLDSGKQYTSEIIDYIDIDFDYFYTGSLSADMDYKYDVSATIIGEYENSDNGNAELWKKNYVILKPQTSSVNDSTSFNIHQDVKINYSEYSKVVDNFKSKFKLAIDAYLDVKLTVSYESTIENSASKVSGTDSMEVKIPLSKTTTKITTNYTKNRKKQILDSNVSGNKLVTNIGIVLTCLDILVFLLLSPKLFISHKSYYFKRLEKIMKEYSEIIVEVESELTFDDLEVLDIKTFDDMVDIEEEIKSPILYYEIEKDWESWFVITTDKYLYRYILKR